MQNEAQQMTHHRRLSDAAATAAASTPSCPSSTSNNLSPSSFGYYDAIYAHAKSTNFASSTRVGSVEVIPPIINDDDDGNPSSIHTNQTYAIMRFITINALSASKMVDGNKTLVARGNNGTQIYGDLSGIMLGIHHFNNGIGTVVEKVTDIHKRCPIRFALDDFFDSESSQTVAVNHFGNTVILNPDRPPSGMFGAWRSAVSVPLAILSGAYEVPQISPLSTSTELDDKNVYSYFGRLIPSDAGTAQAVVDYLTQPGLDVRHLGMIYVNDPYGSTFHQAIVKSSLSRPENDRVTVKGNPFSYSVSESSRDIEIQIQQLALTGYRYFFGVFYDEHYETIMTYAHKHGIAGPGFVWIISDGLSNTFLDGRVYKPGSALAIASQGVGILKAEGGRETMNGDPRGYDRFTKAWYQQGEENVDYYNCKQPKNNTMNDPSIYFKGPSDFFTGRQLSPTAGAVFTYDSAISLGLAACKLYEERGDTYFNGGDLFNGFVSQSFEGASGKVTIDPETTSRDPKSAFFVLYNTNGQSDGEGGTIFSVKTVAHTAPNPESAHVLWVSYNNEAYLYADGTANPPVALPPVEADLNQLTVGIRAVGLTVAAIIFAMALFFGAWTKRNCKDRVIKASQPEFLYMICFGAVVLGSTIIPLSIDDSVASTSGCDIACMSVPWLFNYGFTTVFSALFAKTWRLNKIMENAARRNKMKVKVKDAMKPFVVLFILNTIILVTWTQVDPLKWVRIETGVIDSFGRSIDSYGMCRSNNFVPYVVVLFVINFSLVVLANYQAYNARNLSTEFSESKYISIIMASIFQAVVIGLPLSIIVVNDPVASFLVLTCIIGAMCLSPLCLMFIPKMVAKKKRNAEEENLNINETIAEEENLNTSETIVERAKITQVEADVDDENGEGSGIFMNIWGGAQEIYRRSIAGENDATNDVEEGSNGDGVMSGRSIFVGTLVQSRKYDI